MATTNNTPDLSTHPLTETAAAEMYGTDEEGHTLYAWRNPERAWVVRAMGAAFDAGRKHERTNPADARPWEPLNGRKPRVGDEVRQDFGGVTRTAVVGRVGEDGTPWTTERDLIGLLHWGTWYVRRPVQDVPTEPGTVLDPADGHEYITATVDGQVYRAREAILTRGEVWQGSWRSADGFLTAVHPKQITLDTWKVDDQ